MGQSGKSKLRRAAVPLALIGGGLWALSGCFPVPAFNGAVDGTIDASKQVGSARSRRPLRVGQVTADDVRRVLGEPYAESADGRRVAYGWSVRSGYVVAPLCLQAHPLTGQRTLVLTFGADGRLTKYETLRRNEPVLAFGAMAYQELLPPDLAPTRPRGLRRVPATRPTTQP